MRAYKGFPRARPGLPPTRLGQTANSGPARVVPPRRLRARPVDADMAYLSPPAFETLLEAWTEATGSADGRATSQQLLPVLRDLYQPVDSWSADTVQVCAVAYIEEGQQGLIATCLHGRAAKGRNCSVPGPGALAGE